MRPLRYAINVTLDGCVDHRAGVPDEALHRYWAESLAQADALLFGRVTYEMTEAAWRLPAGTGSRPEWMAEWMEPWMEPFARTIDAARKYVVSNTLDRVEWNAELVRGDELGSVVQRLKQEPGKGLFVGGVTLPLALAELGLIDEYEFVAQPRLAGHGPTVLAGLSQPIDLKLVSRLEFGSGAVALRYEPRRQPSGVPAPVGRITAQREPGLRIRSLTTRPGTSNDSAVSPSLPSSCSHGAGETHPRASSLPSRRPRRLLRRPLASVAPSGRSASRRAPRTPTMAPRERREAGWASERARPSKRRASTANLPTSTTKTSASAGSARPIPGARATSGERAPRQGVVIEVRNHYEAATLACQPL